MSTDSLKIITILGVTSAPSRQIRPVPYLTFGMATVLDGWQAWLAAFYTFLRHAKMQNDSCSKLIE